MSPRATEAQKEQALKMWTEGVSSSDIARRLGPGFTRNQVIGWVHRAKKQRTPGALKATVARPAPRPRPQRPQRAQPRPKPPADARTPEEKKRGDKSTVARMDAPPADTARLKTLVDRGRHECAWPVGGPDPELGQLYCARPVAPGRPYCPDHSPAQPGGTPSPLRLSEKPSRRRNRDLDDLPADLMELFA